MTQSCDINITQIDYTVGGASLDLAYAHHRVREFPLHMHDCYSIAVILGGKHVYRQGHEKTLTGRGSVIMTNPGVPHANIAKDREGWQCLSFYFDEKVFTDVFGDSISEDRSFEFIQSVTEDVYLSQKLMTLGMAAFAKRGRLEQDMQVSRLLAHLLRRYASHVPRNSTTTNSRCYIDQCKAYMHDNIAEDISLADLSHVAGLNADYLCRAFKRQVGMTPHEYLMNIRINQARVNLKKGMRPAEVAQLTGFSDQSHLTRLFRRYTQSTPGQYQREVNFLQENDAITA